MPVVLYVASDNLDRGFGEIRVEVTTEYDQLVPVRAVGAGRSLDQPVHGQQAAGLACRLLAVFILVARMSALRRRSWGLITAILSARVGF